MKIIKYFFISIAIWILPVFVQAAALNFSPSSGSHMVGDTFPVSIYVESADQAINATSSTILFPSDILEVVSLSKTGSIFSLWPTDPSFSNASGSVNLEGVVLNPGYSGKNGKILTVNFKAKKVGVASLNFSSSSVLANDGIGTNILQNTQTATFTIVKDEEIPVQIENIPVSSSGISNAVDIVSYTHPDQTKWYSNNSPEFAWTLPSEAIEVRTILSKSSSAVPSILYNPPIAERKLQDIRDGVYYFSLQIRTKSGWGEVSRYRVNIDTTPPDTFSIYLKDDLDGYASSPTVVVSANNTNTQFEANGRFDMKINDGDWVPLDSLNSKNQHKGYFEFQLPSQFPGRHTVLVKMTDLAGNERIVAKEFVILSIEVPVVTYYTEKVTSGDPIEIRGTTYRDSNILIYVKKNNEIIYKEMVKSGDSGDFSAIIRTNIDVGQYSFTLRAKDDRGAHSNETSPLYISIKSVFISKTMGIILKYLSLIILLLLAIAVIVWMWVHLWSSISSTFIKLHKESQKAKITPEKTFGVLRKDLKHHIKQLKKTDKDFTKEEIEFLDEFENKLKEFEKVVKKKIRNIS